MGNVVAGRDHEDLINKLVKKGHIKTSTAERAFQAVDRAEYYLPEFRRDAYKDLAWQKGHLHISAPCIYAEVVAGLKLDSGMSFLNLGSGTGYFSTVVGLIVGTNGLNHGIEIYDDCIEYAYKKLEDFKRFSGAIDEFDFCEPKFAQANFLRLDNEFTSIYDRIYCGAGIRYTYEEYMKNLLKIGGILVMPLEDRLVQITRIGESKWETNTLLSVSFASAVMPSEGSVEYMKPISIDPLSLQCLCRSVIRNILRKNVETLDPIEKKPLLTKIPRKKRTCRYQREDLENKRNQHFSDDDQEEEDDDAINSNDEMEIDKVEPNKTQNDAHSKVHAVIEHDVVYEVCNRLNVTDFDLRRFRFGFRRVSNDSTDNGSGNNEEKKANSNDDEDTDGLEEAPGPSALEESEENGRNKTFENHLEDEILVAPHSSSSDDDLDNSSCDDIDDLMSGEIYKHGPDSDSEEEVDCHQMRMYKSPYTKYMQQRIQQLPLPPTLKKYVNYNRDFDAQNMEE
ncbi:hypothetical protein ABEB36_009861 [Hypothenemus hampei]|uniref:Protein-L-isoaspartate O-methyltransferase domain-containing protein 1 n=1 Tax=Hypothenemus hampei TaxID=57062 RepID=A0ABD1EHQ8_HYPHA